MAETVGILNAIKEQNKILMKINKNLEKIAKLEKELRNDVNNSEYKNK